MNKRYFKILGIAVILSGAIFIMSGRAEISVEKFHASKLNSSGAPSSRTGAPGESNCTSCHAGTAQDGNNGVNLLTLNGGGTTFVGGAANTMTLELTDPGSRNGFQLVALDGNNEMAGSFSITDATNTSLVSNTQLARDYVTHTFTGGTNASWTFDWVAPTDVSDVTFYVATNKANGSGSSGDVIYLSSHDFDNPQVSVEEVENEFINVGYSPKQHALIIDFPVLSTSEVTVNVLDLSGRSVYFNNEGMFEQGEFTEKVRLPETMNNGIYVVTLFVGNTPYSKKVMINK